MFSPKTLAAFFVCLIASLIGALVVIRVFPHESSPTIRAEFQEFQKEILTSKIGTLVNVNGKAYAFEGFGGTAVKTALLRGGPGTDREQMRVTLINPIELVDKDRNCVVSFIHEGDPNFRQNAEWFWIQ
jgi:hypothetical protein